MMVDPPVSTNEERPRPVADDGATHKVVFQPSGRSGPIAHGTILLEAARQLGVGIEAVCGGHETCNKCSVIVEEGSFARHHIHSSTDHLSPMTERERRYRKQHALAPGSRFSCSARVLGDLLITVPEESQAQKQVILKAASGRTITVDPIIRLHYLELPAPRHGDRDDRRRVLDELAQRYDLRDVGFDYPALRELPGALQSGAGAITLTVWDEQLIIRVQPGYHELPVGLAVDVGSTTVAAYLCDLRSGALLATAAAMNPQVSYGDDIMSRISYATEQSSGLQRLHRAIIRTVNELAAEATARAGLEATEIVDMTMVGNSVMHHLFLRLDPAPLGQTPFVPVVAEAVDMRASQLGLRFHPGARLHALPLEAGFVGADNVGVILSEQPHAQDEVMLVIDVGTNGELVLGNGARLLCTSSPTGPALEGAQITHGMRAAPGAIERIRIDPQSYEVCFKVIGHDAWSNEQTPGSIQARGICGSGIIEAVAELFATGIVMPNGRMAKDIEHPRLIRFGEMDAFVLATAEQSAGGEPIVISQRDVRNVQLAKAALYVSARLLMEALGVQKVDRIVLAGAFGSVIDPRAAMVIGMIPDCDLDRVRAAGNAAGDGARIALLNRAQRAEAARLARWVQHVDQPLAADFQSLFLDALSFPHGSDPFPHTEAYLAARRQAAAPAAKGDQ